jgi:uroporphyrinogen-III decarboxylase
VQNSAPDHDACALNCQQMWQADPNSMRACLDECSDALQRCLDQCREHGAGACQ